MKKNLVSSLAILVAAVGIASVAKASDVGISISLGEPGFYGRIDIGDYPQPHVIYRRPVMIERVSMERAPVYLRVPPGHAKNWRKHCGNYNACGERVLFVQDNWYQREYVPRYQSMHRERRYSDNNDNHGDSREHGNDRGNNHDNNHGNDRRDGHGKDRGR